MTTTIYIIMSIIIITIVLFFWIKNIDAKCEDNFEYLNDRINITRREYFINFQIENGRELNKFNKQIETLKKEVESIKLLKEYLDVEEITTEKKLVNKTQAL